VSMKPSLIAAHKKGELPSSKDGLRPGHRVQGFLQRVTPNGCSVHFSGISVPCHFSRMINTTVSGQFDDVHQFFENGQSVSALLFMNEQRQQIQASIRPSDAEIYGDISWLESFFQEEEMLFKVSANEQNSRKNVDWTDYQIGGFVSATIESIIDAGICLRLEQRSIKGLCLTHHIPEGFIPQVHEKVICRILDIDLQTGIVDVSILNRLLYEDDTFIKNIKAKLGSETRPFNKATIELVKENYFIFSLFNSIIGFCPTKNYNNAKYFSTFENYAPNQIVRVFFKKTFERVTTRHLFSGIPQSRDSLRRTHFQGLIDQSLETEARNDE